MSFRFIGGILNEFRISRCEKQSIFLSQLCRRIVWFNHLTVEAINPKPEYWDWMSSSNQPTISFGNNSKWYSSWIICVMFKKTKKMWTINHLDWSNYWKLTVFLCHRRLVWLTALTTCLVLAVVHGASLIQRYRSYPTRVQLDVSNRQGIALPAVTVCPLDRFDVNRLERLWRHTIGGPAQAPDATDQYYQLADLLPVQELWHKIAYSDAQTLFSVVIEFSFSFFSDYLRDGLYPFLFFFLLLTLVHVFFFYGGGGRWVIVQGTNERRWERDGQLVRRVVIGSS